MYCIYIIFTVVIILGSSKKGNDEGFIDVSHHVVSSLLFLGSMWHECDKNGEKLLVEYKESDE